MLKHTDSREFGEHHDSLADLREHGDLTEAEIEGILVLATARNPFDMLVSNWFKRNGRHDPFLEYLRTVKGTQRNGRLFWRAAEAQAVLKAERLNFQLNEVLTELGAPTVKLPRRGVTVGKPHWPDVYDIDTFTYVLQNFPDVERYHYDRGPEFNLLQYKFGV